MWSVPEKAHVRGQRHSAAVDPILGDGNRTSRVHDGKSTLSVWHSEPVLSNSECGIACQFVSGRQPFPNKDHGRIHPPAIGDKLPIELPGQDSEIENQKPPVLRAENGGKSVALHSQAPLKQLPNLKMKDVHNYIGSVIQQNNVSANQHVCTIRRRWG
jgi:hypothetical protein